MVDGGCVKLSPGEEERYKRETGRQLRCERLRQVRQREDALAQASRSSYLKRRCSDEKQRQAAEVCQLLEKKRQQLLGLLEEQEACNRAHGTAQRQALEHQRRKSLDAARQQQAEAEQRELEALRCQEALRRQREPRLREEREVREQLERQWQLRERESLRAQEAAERGREAVARKEVEARFFELQAREAAKALPRRVHCTDSQGAIDYSKTYYHITQHGPTSEEPGIQADLGRALSPAPAPTPAQLQKAQVRGLAAQAKIATQKTLETAEQWLASEEANCRAEKVQRVVAAAFPQSKSQRPAWGVLRGPAEAAAEAEMAKLLTTVEDDEREMQSEENMPDNEHECTNATGSAATLPGQHAGSSTTEGSAVLAKRMSQSADATSVEQRKRAPMRRAASTAGLRAMPAQLAEDARPASDGERGHLPHKLRAAPKRGSASSARSSKAIPAGRRDKAARECKRAAASAASAPAPRGARSGTAAVPEHRVPRTFEEEVLSGDDSVLASLPSPPTGSPEGLRSDSLTLSRTQLDDTLSESLLNESVLFDDRPLDSKFLEPAPPATQSRAAGGGESCNNARPHAATAPADALSSPAAEQRREPRDAFALTDSPGTPMGDSPLPGAERLAGLLSEAEALLRETASTAAMADAAANLRVPSASPASAGHQPPARPVPHDGWVADGRLWAGGDLGMQLEEICRELDQVVGPSTVR
mmetsp:Transcript_3914/g.7182  ORF Transcript_3914/g.7182 Transcript_3914/m.7182 type:complete len:706 (-) Transcript_3914:156-2273(-)